MEADQVKDGASTSSARTEVYVLSSTLEAMQHAAQRASPREACGILLGDGKHISRAVETRNIHPQPETHFEIDPQALIDAYRAEREGGPKVMGFFHSHPTGDAHPSETDRAMAAHDGKIWAIVSGDRLMFWRDDPSGFQALSYQVADR